MDIKDIELINNMENFGKSNRLISINVLPIYPKIIQQVILNCMYAVLSFLYSDGWEDTIYLTQATFVSGNEGYKVYNKELFTVVHTKMGLLISGGQ